jgi:hypothetical protein
VGLKNMNDNKNKAKIGLVWLIIIAVVLGIGGGVAGSFIAKNYLEPTAVNLPAVTVIDNSQDSLRQANLIIENAKKIIASQENKVNETISSSQNSLVGVFRKNEAAATGTAAINNEKFNIADYYKLDSEVGEGLVVTSDGWVLTTDFSKNSSESLILKNYVIIDKSKDVYAIDQVVKSGIDSYFFVHLVNAKDLAVKSFISKRNLATSQSLVALNWRGESYLTSVVDKKEKSQDIRDSDTSVEKIVLSDNLGDYFDNAFIFSLNIEVAGFFDKKSGLIPFDYFQPLIKGLLEKKVSKRPSLGVTYVNLEDFAIKDLSYGKGALVYPLGKFPAVKEASAAKIAKLQQGDIIVSVDNEEITGQNDLADIIAKYSAGDTISLIYRRAGVENAVKIKLGELK